MRKSFINTDSILIEKPKEWYEAIIRVFRNIKEGLVNLWIWGPTIWKDRWWDSYYILKLLEKKFELMSMKFYQEGHTIDSKKVSENLMRCSRICRKLTNIDEYLHDEIDAHCQKYPIDWLVSAPEIDGTVHYQLVSSLEQQEEMKNLLEREEQMWLTDKQTLFAIMNKELRNWSD